MKWKGNLEMKPIEKRRAAIDEANSLRADADRYRWLRDVATVNQRLFLADWLPKDMDEYIDTRRATANEN